MLRLPRSSPALFSGGLAVAVAVSAQAEGFAIRDLTGITPDTAALSPGEWIDRKAPERLMLVCLGCDGNPMIDILLGRRDDGTEGRVRSGKTTIARLEELCKQTQPDCTITALEVGPAVGWISVWQVGSSWGATAVILRDGDLLTVRSLADTAGLARSNALGVVTATAPSIVGPQILRSERVTGLPCSASPLAPSGGVGHAGRLATREIAMHTTHLDDTRAQMDDGPRIT
jgi:hypothetical protein